jgi:hypothetical protein
LRLKEKWQFPIRENWRVTAYYKGTKRIFKSWSGSNLITTVGKNLVGDMLIDTSGYDTGLTYCAIGTNNTAPAVGDTQLGTETARLAITSKTRLVNVITLSTFFTAAQCTFNIKEAGVFGHSTASGSANSGIIFAHWLVSLDNSGGLYDLTFDHITTLG